MTHRPWFAHKEFTSLDIRKHTSLADHALVKAVRIADVGYIHALAGRIEQIPANGDMMISFSGAAEHIELTFYSGEQVQTVDVIQKGFKTPSTVLSGVFSGGGVGPVFWIAQLVEIKDPPNGRSCVA